MNDKTRLTARVYRCPADQHRAALETLAVFGLDAEYEHQVPVSSGYLAPGQPYICDETATEPADVAEALRNAAPGASWILWREPGEDLHGIRARTPALGDFAGRWDGCDVVLTGSEIKILTDAGADLDAAAGGPWIADWNAAEAEADADAGLAAGITAAAGAILAAAAALETLARRARDAGYSQLAGQLENYTISHLRLWAEPGHPFQPGNLPQLIATLEADR